MSGSLSVGLLVRSRRLALGIRTQQQLADRVAVDRSHIAKIENGTIALPQPELRRRLTEILGLSERDFLIAAGVLAEEPSNYMTTETPDERRLRAIMNDLPPEDAILLVRIAELLLQRHRERTHG